MRKEGFREESKLNCNVQKLWHILLKEAKDAPFLSYCKVVQITGEDVLGKNPV